jgi:His-Xaa-Ser system radical SAM maturase HxsC
MIPLTGNGRPHGVSGRLLGKIRSTEERGSPKSIRMVPEWDHSLDLTGVLAVLCEQPLEPQRLASIPVPVVHSLSLDHLAEGDVVVLDPRGHVRTLYRRASRHNSLFATDRCSSLCLMCSQPPLDVNDDWRIQEMLDTIALIDPTTSELGITGGEPTLLKDGFLEVVRAAKERLPNTSLHVLSNGRLFRYGSLAKQLGEIQHPDLMIGVPVYSDLEDRHDHVVQAKGAFEDTLIGLHNLGRYNVPVEIRVVLHNYTYIRLPQLAEFVYRNLTFASHVTFMGLEMMGYAIANLDAIWVDPWDYREQLEAATLHLAQRHMNVSVYNHQLCTVPESIWPFCVKSISDWKNEYLPQCEACAVRQECGGFFASVVRRRYSQHIQPLGHAKFASA